MPDWPESVGNLVKVLRLEQRKGYNDSAVIGGLDRRVQNWMAELRELRPDSMPDQQLWTLPYREMDAEQRHRWVERVLQHLEEWQRQLMGHPQPRAVEAEMPTKDPADTGAQGQRSMSAPPERP